MFTAAIIPHIWHQFIHYIIIILLLHSIERWKKGDTKQVINCVVSCQLVHQRGKGKILRGLTSWMMSRSMKRRPVFYRLRENVGCGARDIYRSRMRFHWASARRQNVCVLRTACLLHARTYACTYIHRSLIEKQITPSILQVSIHAIKIETDAWWATRISLFTESRIYTGTRYLPYHVLLQSYIIRRGALFCFIPANVLRQKGIKPRITLGVFQLTTQRT